MRLNLRLWQNPIIVKEVRSRMRGVRAFATLTGILILLGGISYALYQLVLVNTRYSSTPVSPQIGQALFSGLMFLELMLVCGITPAVTAGAISGEQEKLTYEMLLATPLRPVSILWGKLISALGYIFLLLFAAVPMSSLIFIFGGVAPRDMFKGLLILVIVAVMLGVLALFMSALFGRTGRATVVSYVVVLAMLLGPMFLAIVLGVVRQAEPPRWILVPSPINAMFSAILPSVGTSGAGGLFWFLGGDFWRLSAPVISQTSIPRPLYHYSLPLFGAITLVLYLVSTRLVQPTRRWRISRRDGLVAFGLLAGYAGLVVLAFFLTTGRYEQNFGAVQAFPEPARVQVESRVVVAPYPGPVQPPPAVAYPGPVAYPGSGEAGQTVVALTPTPLSPPPTPTPSLLIATRDAASIYAAVVQDVLDRQGLPDGNSTENPVVFLLGQTDDTAGDPQAPVMESKRLSEDVQTAVTELLNDLPYNVRWVDMREQVLNENQQVAGGKGLITLGNVHMQGDGTALVSAGFYNSLSSVSGRTYILEQSQGVWQVTGTTGVEGDM
jgi:ABC-2 type transport system permease protein